MLEKYYVRPTTVDRIRAGWLGAAIERYAEGLDRLGYSARTLSRRIQTLIRFGDFARSRGASTWSDLPAHVDRFVQRWVRTHPKRSRAKHAQQTLRTEARTPVEQLLRVVVPGFVGATRRKTEARGVPFHGSAPGFFGYLQEERGLTPCTIRQYTHHLAAFETFLAQTDSAEVARLSPEPLTAFLVASGRRLGVHDGRRQVSSRRADLCAEERAASGSRALRRGQLRDAARRCRHVSALRPCEGSLYGRDPGPSRAPPTSGWRGVVPRRNR